MKAYYLLIISCIIFSGCSSATTESTTACTPPQQSKFLNGYILFSSFPTQMLLGHLANPEKDRTRVGHKVWMGEIAVKNLVQTYEFTYTKPLCTESDKSKDPFLIMVLRYFHDSMVTSVTIKAEKIKVYSYKKLYKPKADYKICLSNFLKPFISEVVWADRFSITVNYLHDASFSHCDRPYQYSDLINEKNGLFIAYKSRTVTYNDIPKIKYWKEPILSGQQPERIFIDSIGNDDSDRLIDSGPYISTINGRSLNHVRVNTSCWIRDSFLAERENDMIFNINTQDFFASRCSSEEDRKYCPLSSYWIDAAIDVTYTSGDIYTYNNGTDGKPLKLSFLDLSSKAKDIFWEADKCRMGHQLTLYDIDFVEDSCHCLTPEGQGRLIKEFSELIEFSNCNMVLISLTAWQCGTEAIPAEERACMQSKASAITQFIKAAFKGKIANVLGSISIPECGERAQAVNQDHPETNPIRIAIQPTPTCN